MNKFVVSASMALLSFSVIAAEPHGNMFRSNRPARQGMEDPLIRAVMNPRAGEELGLSAEQKEKLAALRGAEEADRELQKKVGEKMRYQVELLEADSIDEDAVMASIDEVFELRKAMAKAQTKRLIDVRSILDPEQIKKARGMVKGMRERARSRGEGPRGNGPRKEK